MAQQTMEQLAKAEQDAKQAHADAKTQAARILQEAEEKRQALFETFGKQCADDLVQNKAQAIAQAGVIDQQTQAQAKQAIDEINHAYLDKQPQAVEAIIDCITAV